MKGCEWSRIWWMGNCYFQKELDPDQVVLDEGLINHHSLES